ncbi:hypothetical protein BD410DRAFT_443440 [Rickenella mellea]|uniref:Dystroglycan-type cadherin-like domain-containing protein n=1 Tax=Rickenella mellea TaxID=50990 RepID=A0A4Y7PV26_9AGAM|nr:hypothetical protein BD410DRAFT_443440 [Rickenella mellea]
MIQYTILLSLILVTRPLRFVQASSSVLLPIQDQLPLIARVNQQYSWSISTSTFSSDISSASNIAASKLPSWLSFSNYTFSGNPAPEDEGNYAVTLSSGNQSDSFTICVTPFPPPVPNIPLSTQFNATNPSFSSVFLLHNGSALLSQGGGDGDGDSDGIPTLRVPPQWSFSVGLEGPTFVPANPDKSVVDTRMGSSDLFYYALQADGSPLPDWLSFNPRTVTFNGVTKAPPTYDPERFSIVLIASDQEGYSAVKAPFDIMVASHELWLSNPQSTLPLYATRGEDFSFDFSANSGPLQSVMVDNRSINAADIKTLSVDTSAYTWMTFDAQAFNLSGTAPSAQAQPISLPMTLEAFNQSMSLKLSLTFSPSYFNAPNTKPLFAVPGSDVNLPLDSYFSSDPSFQGHDVELSASFDPSAASSYLHLSQTSGGGGEKQRQSGSISGSIPSDVAYSEVTITITAYDHSTLTSSHLTALIDMRTKATYTTPSSSSSSRNRKLALGLGVGFGVVGGVVLLFGILAVCRKCCSVKDSAVDADANEKAFVLDEGHGYGWTEKLGLGLGLGRDKGAERDAENDSVNVNGAVFERIPYNSPYPGVGLGDAPIHANNIANNADKGASIRMMKKAAFFQGVKAQMRRLSGSMARRDKKKAMIGKPILMFTKHSADSVSVSGVDDGLPLPNPHHQQHHLMNLPNSNIALAGSVATIYKEREREADGMSLGLNSSPSSSTGQTGKSGRSVPRRRPDFGPPRATLGVTLSRQQQRSQQQQRDANPAAAANANSTSTTPNQHMRRRSNDTQHSGSSGDIEEAVIATASRASSIRSGHSSLPYASSIVDAGVGTATATRPRLVQFTSAKGVPVPIPNLPAGYQRTAGGAGGQDGGRAGGGRGGEERRVSHVADVVEANDDVILNEGMRYVRAFGNQNEDLEPTFPPNLSSPGPAPASRTPTPATPATTSTGSGSGTGSGTKSPAQSVRSSMRPASTGTVRTGEMSLSVPTSSMRSHSPMPTQTSYIYPSPSASFDSALDGGAATTMSRILVGTGEAFVFKFPVSLPPSSSSSSSPSANKNKKRVLKAAMLYGSGALPAFMGYAYSPAGDAGVRDEVEFWGTPKAGDVGEVVIGVFDQDGECVGRLVVEVVGRG